ncbi:MAG: hypothetical protein R3301_05080 [Saprospiraceae bacterium]|nr:hypothetical protein [Saprospiraceae bacterium]
MTTPAYRHTFFLGLICIAIGIAMNNAQGSGSFGTILAAMGGYFIIAAMASKQQERTS